MKNSPTPSNPIMTEAAIRKKEDTENRKNRMATRTVKTTTKSISINFNISLVNMAPFFALSTTILPCMGGATMLCAVSKSCPRNLPFIEL